MEWEKTFQKFYTTKSKGGHSLPSVEFYCIAFELVKMSKDGTDECNNHFEGGSKLVFYSC